MIQEHADALERIAEALLEREVLDADQIAALVRGEPLGEPPEPTETQASPDEGTTSTSQDKPDKHPGVLPEPGNQPA